MSLQMGQMLGCFRIEEEIGSGGSSPADHNGMAHRSYVSPDGKWVLLVEIDLTGWLPCRLVSRWQMDVLFRECWRRFSHLAPVFPQWHSATTYLRRCGGAGNFFFSRRKILRYSDRFLTKHALVARFARRTPDHFRGFCVVFARQNQTLLLGENR